MRTLALCCLVVVPAAALAQTGDKATANALFDDGKKLMRDGHIDEACAKFEASLAIYTQIGVRLNLADCYERAGRLASAWGEFREAASVAARQGDARETFARERVGKLEPRLPRLVVTLARDVAGDGLTIARDGGVLSTPVLGTAVPVNPGEHVVTARASGRQPFESRVVAVEGKVLTVEVPALQPLEVPRPKVAEPPPRPVVQPAPSKPPIVMPAPPRKPPLVAPAGVAAETVEGGRGRRRLGVVVGLIGVGVAAVGLGFGAVAMSKFNGAKDNHDCDPDLSCSPSGIDTVQSAQKWGTVSTVTVGLGIAGVATGTILYLTAPRSAPAVSLVPPGVGPAMVTVSGRF